MNKDKVLEKLRKLKALYEGAKEIGSEEEAANAASKMSKIMNEYNLSMSDITDAELKSRLQHSQYDINTLYRSIGGKWQILLLTTLSKHNFVRCYTCGKHKAILVGSKENADNVYWLFEHLSFKMVELSKIRWKELYNKTMSKDKFQRDYLLGMVMSIEKRLSEERKEEERIQTANSAALVLRNQRAIEEYVKEILGPIKDKKTKVTLNGSSKMGFEDGKKMSINDKAIQSKVKQLGYSK